MPDQNNPTDVSSTPTQANPPSEPTQMPTTPPAPMDIPVGDASIPPPFPPESSPIEGVAPPSDSGSAAPSFDIPPVVTPTSPKKKFGGKRVIATILGLLVLVGGVGAGIVLVRQQQDIREKAAGPGQSCSVGVQSGTCTTISSCTGAGGIFKGTSSGGCVSPAGQNIGCCTCNSGNCYNDCLCKGNTATECRAACPTPTTVPCNSGNCYNDCLCRGNTATECRAACPTASPTITSSPTAQTCRTGWLSGGTNRDAAEEACIGQCGYRNVAAREGNCNWENRGSGTLPNWCYQCIGVGGVTPTSPPPGGGPTAQCLNVKAYDTNWNLLSPEDLSKLEAGDTVRFAVAGQTTGGSFDKARFKFNGVQRPEVTQKKPSSEEYYDEYTVPEGVASFTINAQIHHATLGWSE